LDGSVAMKKKYKINKVLQRQLSGCVHVLEMDDDDDDDDDYNL
jgi:hypothetical protein